ncbi:MAG: hypothetical protein AB7K63_03735 [Vicinamibacterales bacterium]
MGTAAGRSVTVEALRDRVVPGIEAFEDAVRTGRHAFAEGKHFAEAASVKAQREIKRHPLRAVAIAAGAGALFGVVLAIGAAACRSRAASDRSAECW